MSRITDTPAFLQKLEDVRQGRTKRVKLDYQYDVELTDGHLGLMGLDNVVIEAKADSRVNVFIKRTTPIVFPFGSMRHLTIEPFFCQLYDERPQAERIRPPCNSAIDISSVSGVGRNYSTRNEVGPIIFELNRCADWGITLGTQPGMRDVNNEWNQLWTPTINNYLSGAYYQTGRQCKENVIHSPRFAGNDTGKVGIYQRDGTVNVKGAGRIGGNSEADIVLRSLDGEPMSFDCWNSEGSGRMLDIQSGGPGAPISMRNFRWAHNKLLHDQAAIRVNGRVSLKLEDGQLGDNDQRVGNAWHVPKLHVMNKDAQVKVLDTYFAGRNSLNSAPLIMDGLIGPAGRILFQDNWYTTEQMQYVRNLSYEYDLRGTALEGAPVEQVDITVE